MRMTAYGFGGFTSIYLLFEGGGEQCPLGFFIEDEDGVHLVGISSVDDEIEEMEDVIV